MAKWEPSPFVVRRSLVIEGGWLQSPWAVNTKLIDGADFTTLSQADRCLAKALGMNMSDRSPLARCSVLPHMAKVRDAKVDEIIFAAQVDNDPMADASSSDLAAANRLPGKGRSRAFDDAQVPQTIPITMKAFVTPEGQRVDEHTCRVVTTPKRGANVMMEVIPENFEWLVLAAHVDWDIEPKTKKRRQLQDGDENTLPELQQPLKYLKTAGGQIKICCYYRQQGVWKKHQRGLHSNVTTGTSFEAIVRSTEAEVMDFFNSHHEQEHDIVDEAPPLTM